MIHHPWPKQSTQKKQSTQAQPGQAKTSTYLRVDAVEELEVERVGLASTCAAAKKKKEKKKKEVTEQTRVTHTL